MAEAVQITKREKVELQKRKLNRANWFDVLNVIIMLFVLLVTLYPFIYIISVSLSQDSMVGEISLIPKGLNFSAYKLAMSQETFWIGYRNTIVYTVLGTIIALFLTILCAYPLSKKSLPGGKVLMTLFSFTMFFNGGLIPTYLTIKQLHMLNTIWVMVLPGAISVWNMILMRTFFKGIPVSLEEAAAIDGMNDIGILFRIVLPLSKSIIATIGLFTVVGIWNDWFGALIYLNDTDRYPVTMMLRNLLNGASLANKDRVTSAQDVVSIGENLKSATILLISLPIICVYPFVQKYFVKGVMIGSIKG